MASKKASKAEPTDTGKKYARVPVGDVPEVQEFLDLDQELIKLRADNPEVFMVYNDLVDRRNTKLEEANDKVRALGVTCGPFENFSVSHTYDAAKMLDELGEKAFLACGGKITNRAYYEVDTAVVAAAIAGGKVPQAAVENFMSVKRSYHAPKKIVG